MSSRTIGPGRRGLVFSPKGIRIGKKKKFGGKDISYPDCFSAGGVSITHQGFIFVAGDLFFSALAYVVFLIACLLYLLV